MDMEDASTLSSSKEEVHNSLINQVKESLIGTAHEDNESGKLLARMKYIGDLIEKVGYSFDLI